jgi:hypothetical protein
MIGKHAISQHFSNSDRAALFDESIPSFHDGNFTLTFGNSRSSTKSPPSLSQFLSTMTIQILNDSVFIIFMSPSGHIDKVDLLLDTVKHFPPEGKEEDIQAAIEKDPSTNMAQDKRVALDIRGSVESKHSHRCNLSVVDTQRQQ